MLAGSNAARLRDAEEAEHLVAGSSSRAVGRAGHFRRALRSAGSSDCYAEADAAGDIDLDDGSRWHWQKAETNRETAAFVTL